MRDNIEELKARIVAVMDVAQVLDILGYDLTDLVEVLEEEIENQAEEFERACS